MYMTKYALTRREKQRHTPLHPTPLPSSHLPSPFPHSSAFPTFGQKKRLENEPEKKGPGRSKLSRRRPGPGEGPGRTRSQGEESQREGARENKELEPESTRARQGNVSGVGRASMTIRCCNLRKKKSTYS